MEFHKKNINDFHLMRWDHSVLFYHTDKYGKCTKIEPIKTNNRPPGMHGAEYEHMDATTLSTVYKAK
jgi:hypothetical protein